MRPLKLFLPLGLVLVLLCPQSGWSQTSQKEAEQTAALLATLLNAGRVIVERNQFLINDPQKADKGFTPGVFEQLVLDEFTRQTRVDLKASTSSVPASTKELLTLLISASKDVVQDAQFVINQRGIGYKNFIPATFGSQAARKFSKRSKVTMKQTALEPRNLQNAPDEYEEMVLKRLASQPSSTTPIVEWLGGGQLLRAVVPIYYSEDCLVCHGNPKGILDMSGYPREGAQAGELAGAISIQIPSDHR
ncbi:MAG: Tll0287-like domain-containing protein [Nitrospiraceae bacterium]